MNNIKAIKSGLIVAAVAVIGLTTVVQFTATESQAQTLYKSALKLKSEKQFNSSAENLRQALSLNQNNAELEHTIKDELHLHLPLQKIRDQFYNINLSEAESIINNVETYFAENIDRLGQSPDRNDTVALIKKIRTALTDREKGRINKLRSLLTQYINLKAARRIKVKPFPEWAATHIPEQMELKHYSGNYEDHTYRHEAKFHDLKNNVAITFKKNGEEIQQAITPHSG